MPTQALHAQELGAIVKRDPVAWNRLVRRVEPLLRWTLAPYRLGAADVDDVLQATWLELHRGAHRIIHADALISYLTVTARRQAMRCLQRSTREVLSDDPYLGEVADVHEPLDEVLAAERQATIGRGLATLPEHQRRVMVALFDDASPNYREVADALGVPLGSIGPTRVRSLERMARMPELAALHAA